MAKSQKADSVVLVRGDGSASVIGDGDSRVIAERLVGLGATAGIILDGEARRPKKKLSAAARRRRKERREKKRKAKLAKAKTTAKQAAGK